MTILAKLSVLSLAVVFLAGTAGANPVIDANVAARETHIELLRARAESLRELSDATGNPLWAIRAGQLTAQADGLQVLLNNFRREAGQKVEPLVGGEQQGMGEFGGVEGMPR